MSRLIDLNREFYDRMHWDYPDKPVMMDAARRSEMMAYVISEMLEFGNSGGLVSQVDALTDAMYFILDTFLEMGVDPEEAYKIIHKHNVMKRLPGTVVRFDHNVVPPKLIKPEGWVSPKAELEELLSEKYEET